MFKILKSKIFQLFLSIILAFVLGHIVDVWTVSLFYSISSSIKAVLIFILPIIIFSCIFNALSHLKGGIKLAISLLAVVCISNFVSAMLSYFVGVDVIGLANTTVNVTPVEADADSKLLWHVPALKLIANDKALIIGILFGIITSIWQDKRLLSLGANVYKLSMLFLQKIFIPVLPLFIFGFILSLSSEGMIDDIISNNGKSVMIMASLALLYVLVLYVIISGGCLKKLKLYLLNVLPPLVTAFSTMSSAAAIPLSIEAARKSSGKKGVSSIVVPTTVNIHLVGDGIFVPLMALIIINLFGMPMPVLDSFIIFAFYFVLAKFAVAGIPGGGIIVMVPILEKYLGFNSEMSAIITAFYILLDPIITSLNVLGNNVLAVAFSNLYKCSETTE